jgi:hypothetical protein
MSYAHTMIKIHAELQAGIPALPGVFSDKTRRNEFYIFLCLSLCVLRVSVVISFFSFTMPQNLQTENLLLYISPGFHEAVATDQFIESLFINLLKQFPDLVSPSHVGLKEALYVKPGGGRVGRYVVFIFKLLQVIDEFNEYQEILAGNHIVPVPGAVVIVAVDVERGSVVGDEGDGFSGIFISVYGMTNIYSDPKV